MNSTLYKLQQLFPDGKITSKYWYNINCEFCQNHGHTQDVKYHFGINYKYGYTNCFRCGTKYKLTYFLKIVHIEYDKDDFVFEDSPLTITKKLDIEFPKGFVNTLDLFDSRYSSYVDALEYIDKRIGIDLALKINAGFCRTGKYANRVVIPIFDPGDNMTYFIARAIYKFIQPKILNPFGGRRTILFNWNIAQRFSEIFIMEGVFGALTVYPYGIASLGKEITDDQILVILRSKVKIINIVLDGNAIEDAYKVADKILGLTSKIKVRVLELKKETQPDDFSFDHLIRLKSYFPFYKRLF